MPLTNERLDVSPPKPQARQVLVEQTTGQWEILVLGPLLSKLAFILYLCKKITLSSLPVLPRYPRRHNQVVFSKAFPHYLSSVSTEYLRVTSQRHTLVSLVPCSGPPALLWRGKEPQEAFPDNCTGHCRGSSSSARLGSGKENTKPQKGLAEWWPHYGSIIKTH